MGKLINFEQYVEKKKQSSANYFYRAEYKPLPNCKNSDSYGVICLKCGKCGRKFK